MWELFKLKMTILIEILLVQRPRLFPEKITTNLESTKLQTHKFGNVILHSKAPIEHPLCARHWARNSESNDEGHEEDNPTPKVKIHSVWSRSWFKTGEHSSLPRVDDSCWDERDEEECFIHRNSSSTQGVASGLCGKLPRRLYTEEAILSSKCSRAGGQPKAGGTCNWATRLP